MRLFARASKKKYKILASHYPYILIALNVLNTISPEINNCGNVAIDDATCYESTWQNTIDFSSVPYASIEDWQTKQGVGNLVEVSSSEYLKYYLGVFTMPDDYYRRVVDSAGDKSAVYVRVLSADEAADNTIDPDTIEASTVMGNDYNITFWSKGGKGRVHLNTSKSNQCLLALIPGVNIATLLSGNLPQALADCFEIFPVLPFVEYVNAGCGNASSCSIPGNKKNVFGEVFTVLLNILFVLLILARRKAS